LRPSCSPFSATICSAAFIPTHRQRIGASSSSRLPMPNPREPRLANRLCM
jgi:hypothetical protein